MPVLSQCLPYVQLKEQTQGKEHIEKIKDIGQAITQVRTVFGNNILTKSFLDEAYKAEQQCIKVMWHDNEYIPSSCRKSVVPISSYGSLSFSRSNYVEGQLSIYPLTDISNIISLADKLDMVIVPLEYVNLKAILEAHNIYVGNRGWGYSSKDDFYGGIEDCRKALKAIDYQKSQMYILCPLSYYNVWEEIKSDKPIPKYNPISLESIFTTIDLMIPAQRNLYKMSKTNEENTKSLVKNLQENIEMVNNRLKSLENRMSKVESQIKEIIEEQSRQAAERAKQDAKIAEQARTIALQQAQIASLTYAQIDPLIFFVNGEPVDFLKTEERKRKAHVVACFGPEFPLEFFVKNGVKVYHDIVNSVCVSIPSNVYRLE